MAIPKALADAIKLAAEKASEDSESGRLAASLLKLMDEAAAELEKGPHSRPSRRGTGKLTYVVEETQQGEVVSEHRGSGRSKAFRCPRAVYEALANVLAGAERALLLDELNEAVAAKLGDRAADHQVRLALRLWLSVEPPLITRNRARYRASSPSTIVESTTNLWKQLRS